MSPTKLSNFVSRILIIFGFSFFFNSNLVGEESIDIWKKENKNIKKTIQKENTVENSKIDYSKKDKSLGQIKIIDTDEEEKELASLPGLYDPEQNDLRMSMWSNTDGLSIKNTFNRISKIKLSNFSEKLFIDTIFTYSYPPKKNLSQEEFLKLKLKWLVDNNKIDLMEEFLNMNLEFQDKSKLIKFLVDHYIASAEISKSCEKANLINKEIKDKYLDKFRIYCLVLNKKNDEAQLNFDLLREEKRSDEFFNNKILFLLGINEKQDNKISDKNLLYFYLSSVTVENFKYEPDQKTDKNIWKYLTASNLISTEKLEDPEIIKKYENAAQEGTFDKNKIFEIYMSVPFNINQLINAETAYLSLTDYESRALIYQKMLLSDNLENKLDLLFLLKDLFNKDKLDNIYVEYLSDTLKSIDENQIPDNLKKIVKKNIILEKTKELGKIKYDDKVLHRSKIIKYFTEENTNKEKANKDFLNVYKKVSKNKKYFFSIKDVILLETLSSDGFKMPKDFDKNPSLRNLTVPANINALVEKEEIGMLMLKLIEIIGTDDIQNLDPETLYFIVNLLNKAEIKKVRNRILNLTLPLRV
tara:strand:- start:2613 stop:4364 length:1752 start_codon:yes stop_codon:yes gene_type:complete